MADKSKIVMAILIIIIVIMATVMLYVFVISPSITGYTIDRQIEGYQIALEDIVQIVSQCQPFPITIGEGQTINLVALECLQIPEE